MTEPVQNISEFNQFNDEHLIELAKSNPDALENLIKKFRPLAISIANKYFIPGADHEDLLQEAMVGLYKAIRDFQPEKTASFKSFADICIRRHIQTAIKTANRKKHFALNSYVSLDQPAYEGEKPNSRKVIELIPAQKTVDYTDFIITEEESQEIVAKLGQLLTPLEWQVLMYYIDGNDYKEIAIIVKQSTKAVDNALQRVKRKLDNYLSEASADMVKRREKSKKV